MLISLFGATAGRGVIRPGQFYALFYLQTILRSIRPRRTTSSRQRCCWACHFVVMGALSDRIGRKRLMMAGCLLAARHACRSTEQCSAWPGLGGDGGVSRNP
jgi:MFS family permease